MYIDWGQIAITFGIPIFVGLATNSWIIGILFLLVWLKITE